MGKMGFSEAVRPEILDAFKTLREVFENKTKVRTEAEAEAEIKRRTEQHQKYHKDQQRKASGLLNMYRERLTSQGTSEQQTEFNRLAELLETGKQGESISRTRDRMYGWSNEAEALRKLIKKATGRMPDKMNILVHRLHSGQRKRA